MSQDYDYYFGRLNEVSVNELIYALGSTDTSGMNTTALDERARRMFARIVELRKPVTRRTPIEDLRNIHEPTGSKGEYNPAFTFTARELDQSLQRLGHLTWPGLPAITQDIKDHREPEWKAGDIVRSANNIVFVLQPSKRWLNQATLLHVLYGEPQRPLTKIGEVHE
jgi:hypothetical protein